ncbi:MAG TPA: flagellar export chaperone FliS [Candidatus Acidoferrum sp.]|nr:flagellar export chaperone FliS [Candidatus Acidoferrum sp.]
MPDINPYENYLEQAVSTHTPGELVILLYDRALFQINMASRSIEQKKVGEAHAGIRKAQDIIAYLRDILDARYTVAGTIAECYTVILRQLTAANIGKDKEALEDAAKGIRTLRDAWKFLEAQAHMAGADRRAKP